MNYFRFYVGDYLRDTPRLSITEHGAYSLMLGYYYADEKPLPADKQEIYTMTRAMTPADRKAIDKILERYFRLEGDGYHNARADHEIEVSKKARDNGGKGGRPVTGKQTGSRTGSETGSGTEKITGEQTGDITGGVAGLVHPPTTNLQPPTTSPQPPEKSSAADPPVDNLKATQRGAMAAALRAEGVTGITPSHPLLVQWVEKGVTIQQAREALDLARERKPKPAKIPAAYLDPIIAQVIGAGPQPQSKVNGHDNLEWWQTAAGIKRKGEELGVKIRTTDEPSMILTKCAIAARIGTGPWINERDFTENRIRMTYEKDYNGPRELAKYGDEPA